MTEWKTYKIGEIIDEIAMGPFGSNIKVDNFVDFGVPVLNGANLQGFKLKEESFNYVPSQKADSLGKANAYRGDIVITHRGTLGQIVYIPNDSKFERYIISQSQFRVRLNSQYVLPEYFVYYFHTRLGRHKLLMNASQVGVPALARPTSTFKDVTIDLPPLEKQRRIAGILGAIDDKIENNRRINANLESQAQALYKQWFVDNSSDEWEVGKVSDYYDITIGKTPPRKEKQWFSNNPKDSVWVSISDMGSCGAYISDSSEYLTTKAVDKFNIKVVPNNTVLLSFKLTVGRVAISDGAMTTNEAIAHFNTLNDYLTEYTYLALKAYNFANLGSTSSIATAVNSKIIKSMLWVMPNDNVLRDFHNIVAPIFTQIKNNIRENETLATLRDTLLPKLMNGEINCKTYECID